MENLAHTLAGAVMCKAGLDRKSALAMPAILIAANLPDSDVLGSFFGKDYLDFHRGITHAAVGVCCLSFALAAVFWGADRLRSNPVRPPVRFWPLWYVGFLGLLSHPFLDFLNDYGIRPWLPFSERKYFGDLVNIVDPWMWAIFGSAMYVISRTKWGKIRWIGLGLLLGSLVALGGGWRLAVMWISGLGAIGFATVFLARRGFRPARVALVVFSLYLAGIAIIREGVVFSARNAAQDLVPEPNLWINVLPSRNASFLSWTVILEGAADYYIADVNTFQSWLNHPPHFESFSKNLTDPCYLQSLNQKQMAVMNRFARFPSAEVVTSRDYCTVYLKDLRYSRRRGSGFGVAVTRVPRSPSPVPRQNEN